MEDSNFYNPARALSLNNGGAIAIDKRSRGHVIVRRCNFYNMLSDGYSGAIYFERRGSTETLDRSVVGEYRQYTASLFKTFYFLCPPRCPAAVKTLWTRVGSKLPSVPATSHAPHPM